MNTVRTSRGLRLCNPLNIRRTADLWQGLAKEQNDPEFFTFKSIAWGYRAAFIVLRTYIRKYGINTVAAVIGRWAPPEDGNDTDIYVRQVCVLTGFAPDRRLNPLDPRDMAPLVAAMSRVECGAPAVMAEVRAGWELYYGLE